jgi:hypothetical protein
MSNEESVGWPGAALVARLPGLRRPTGQRRPSKAKTTLQRISRLAALKQYIQARINEVARVLRTPPPPFRINHLGQATLGDQPVHLDLSQVEALQRRGSQQICATTLLRASLAALFVPLLQGEWLRRLLPSSLGRLASMADFLAGYVLAAFRATFETRRAFLREIAPLPDKQSPQYQDRLFAFEQGQLAFNPA